MKLSKWLGTLLMVGVMASLVAGVRAEDKKDDKKPADTKKDAPPAKPADAKKDAPAPGDKKPTDAKKDDKGGMDPAMAAMMEMGKPGPQHKALEGWVGNWDHVTKWRMDPKQPWGESKGTTMRESLWGGRFIRQETKSAAMGEGMPPFEGRGIYGYDNMRKQYFTIWIDNEGTSAYVGYGTADASGKVITYSSEEPDWKNPGKMKKGKQVYRIKDDKTHVFEMYDTGDDGKEYVMLEVTYTKK